VKVVPVTQGLADVTDIAWTNMRCGDKLFNLEWFIGGSMGWLKANPGKNYQDLETELRQRDLNTHLIATKPRYSALKIPYSKGGATMDFECIMSCRPKDAAMKELLTHAESYEENWARLAFSGSIFTGDADDNREGIDAAVSSADIRNFEDREKTLMSRLSNNEVTLEVREITFQEHMKELESKYADVRTEVYGVTAGGPLLVCVAGKPPTVVSDIGFVLSTMADGSRLIRPIHLNDLVVDDEQDEQSVVPPTGNAKDKEDAQ
jgi:hypothetical protein